MIADAGDVIERKIRTWSAEHRIRSRRAGCYIFVCVRSSPIHTRTRYTYLEQVVRLLLPGRRRHVLHLSSPSIVISLIHAIDTDKHSTIKGLQSAVWPGGETQKCKGAETRDFLDLGHVRRDLPVTGCNVRMAT